MLTNYKSVPSQASVLLLTFICWMDFPIIIIWMSPLSILGESGIFFHFYFIFIEIPVSKQCRPRWDLIWVYTVCLCPKNGTPGLYGFIPVWFPFESGNIKSYQTHQILPKASRTVLASKICCSTQNDVWFVTEHRYCRINFVFSVCKDKQKRYGKYRS